MAQEIMDLLLKVVWTHADNINISHYKMVMDKLDNVSVRMIYHM